MKDSTRQILTPLLESDETISPDQIEQIMSLLNSEVIENKDAGEPERYMTLREVGRKLGISPCSLWRWGVPGHALGGRRRFRLSEVEAYLHSSEFERRAEELRKQRALN